MATFKPGLVHTPVTPFKRDHSIDFDAYGTLLEFHLRHGADALALPMPQGEDMSLTDEEQRTLLEFAIERVKGRVPVIAHVSDAGTRIAVERVRHAAQKFVAAREPQEYIAALHHLVKKAGLAGLKGALRAMERDCGQPRPPARALSQIEYTKLAGEIGAMDFLRAEPRGW